jgi:hypothetical protein
MRDVFVDQPQSGPTNQNPGDHHEHRGPVGRKVHLRLFEGREDQREDRGRHHHSGGETEHRVLNALGDPLDDEHRQRPGAGKEPSSEACPKSD